MTTTTYAAVATLESILFLGLLQCIGYDLTKTHLHLENMTSFSHYYGNHNAILI